MARNHTPGARRVVPRSRGALSGIALIVLGLWGALIPFIGPYFNFSFTPDDAWHWTAARGWLEVLPGAAAFVGGVLLLVSRSRATTLVAAWLGIAAGAWFAVGPQLRSVWHIGSPGQPAGSSAGLRALETLALFTLLGVVIVYFAATAFGRLSVVSLRDADAAERREAAAAAEAEREAERERERAAAREREAATVREREAATAREREAATAREREAASVREREAASAAAAHDRTAAGSHEHEVAGIEQHDERDIDERDVDQHAVDHQAADQRTDDQRTDDQQTDGSTAVIGDGAGQPTYAQRPEQGYAQPQRYDPQHGYPQQASNDEPIPADTEHESIGRRLFRRR